MKSPKDCPKFFQNLLWSLTAGEGSSLFYFFLVWEWSIEKTSTLPSSFSLKIRNPFLVALFRVFQWEGGRTWVSVASEKMAKWQMEEGPKTKEEQSTPQNQRENRTNLTIRCSPFSCMNLGKRDREHKERQKRDSLWFTDFAFWNTQRLVLHGSKKVVSLISIFWKNSDMEEGNLKHGNMVEKCGKNHQQNLTFCSCLILIATNTLHLWNIRSLVHVH